MNILAKISALLTVFFLSLSTAFAYTSPGTPAGFVNDYANLFTSTQKTALETKLVDYEKRSSNEITVVTIPSLHDETIESFAVKLFEEWKIGKVGKDNGVLLLVAVQERQMKIEVGYGLEPELTDAQSSWIIRNTLTPAFRSETYYEGVDTATAQIIDVIGGEVLDTETNNSMPTEDTLSMIWAVVFMAGVFNAVMRGVGKVAVSGIAALLVGLMTGSLIFGILAAFGVQIVSLLLGTGIIGGGRWGGGRMGGGGGGGFGGFGGGRSGGGGSSGSW